MAWRWIFLAVCGASAGVLVSAGVFTVLLAVGLVPRFAGKTHTASKIFLYEEMVVIGTLFGGCCSVFERIFEFGGRVESYLEGLAVSAAVVTGGAANGTEGSGMVMTALSSSAGAAGRNALLTAWRWAGNGYQAVFGLFSGVFVGCLALAIAEMLDSIPIFTRRIGFRHGLGFMVLATALGKLTGSLIYFLCGYFQIAM